MKAAALQTEDRGLWGEKATASVYMILLPLPVLEPDLITDQP